MAKSLRGKAIGTMLYVETIDVAAKRAPVFDDRLFGSLGTLGYWGLWEVVADQVEDQINEAAQV
jgi:hypothetical protein